MAYATITVSNGLELKKVPIGYSWTVLFWGPIPPALRQDWKWAIGLFICNLFTYNLVSIVASFFYNKIYAKSLFNAGYVVHHMPENITPEMLCAYLGFVQLPTETRSDSAS